MSTYAGMNYEQASREAERVLERYGWYIGWERLSELRTIMMGFVGGPEWQPPKGQSLSR